MSTPRILLLDHPTRSVRELARTLEEQGFRVAQTADPEQALQDVRDGAFEVVLGEVSLGGEELLRQARSSPLGPPVILFDDFATMSEAMDAVRRGAFDTIIRPVPDEQVVIKVRRALEQTSLLAENRRLKSEVGEWGGLVSRDPRMMRLFETLASIADSRAGVLILGESGTGKTALARLLHERSSRSGGPYVVVNCGALPASLLESELFGHTRGSFTGAVRDREGKFEAAHGGTIFLDEIATASQELQVKLLRVIEEGAFERVGETVTRHVDVRIVSATNVELEEEVAAGRFRQDLYYRINVVGVRVPPLRDRVGDVALLAERFLKRFSLEHGKPIEGLTHDALTHLCSHEWPGNVRELENTIERGVLLASSPRLQTTDLWPDRHTPSVVVDEGGPCAWQELPLGPLKEALAIPERWILLRALEECGGNRQETARLLGVNRTTLFNKMRKYDLGSFPQAGASGGAGSAGGSR